MAERKDKPLGAIKFSLLNKNNIFNRKYQYLQY